MGLNCAEAVNFAPADWLRFGAASTERIRGFRKQPILAHSWLLLKVPNICKLLCYALMATNNTEAVPGIDWTPLLQVAEEDVSAEMAFWATQELQRVVHEEVEWRFRLQRLGAPRNWKKHDALDSARLQITVDQMLPVTCHFRDSIKPFKPATIILL